MHIYALRSVECRHLKNAVYNRYLVPNKVYISESINEFNVRVRSNEKSSSGNVVFVGYSV